MSHSRGMDHRLTNAVPGLPCPTCGDAIFPCPSGEDLQFYCPQGHGILEPDLPIRQTDSARFAVSVALDGWQRTLAKLELASAEAQARGLYSVAEILQRQIPVLKARIQAVREALQPDRTD